MVKRPRKRTSSVAVIDIGSNSVRLVIYAAMARSLVSVFNEKTLCGLGREVQSTGLLAPDAVTKALTSLRRFRALCRTQKVGRAYAIATAACRYCCASSSSCRSQLVGSLLSVPPVCPQVEIDCSD